MFRERTFRRGNHGGQSVPASFHNLAKIAASSRLGLSAALGRRAERLLAVAPKLRARGADVVVGRLLDEDALVAAHEQHKTGMSDRGLRRLFDRLVELDAVRELSGRPAFRIYGL